MRVLIILAVALLAVAANHHHNADNEINIDPSVPLDMNFTLSAEFDLTLSTDLGRLGYTVFCPANKLINWNCGLSCSLLTGWRFILNHNNSAGHDGFIVYAIFANDAQKRIVIEMQATSSYTQLFWEAIEWSGLDYSWLNVPNAVVDSFFGNAYFNYIRPTMLGEVESLVQQYPDYQFIFSGVSLGAALATLGAHDAVASGKVDVVAQNVVLYTYGSPRVGNPYFAFALDKAIPNIFRVVHYKDLVPHVPPCGLATLNPFASCNLDSNSLFWNPWHAGTQIFYNEEMSSYQTCTENYGEQSDCSNQFSILSWKDHINGYAKDLPFPPTC